MPYSTLERWYNLMHLSKTTPPQASDVRDLRRFVVYKISVERQI